MTRGELNRMLDEIGATDETVIRIHFDGSISDIDEIVDDAIVVRGDGGDIWEVGLWTF